MTAIRSAIGLLTRWPVRPVRDAADGVSTGAAAFPIVGAGIGSLGAVLLVVLGPAEPALAAILAIGVMALVSGGLHLDGLADTVDALLAPDPARAEAARTDPAIGAGGAVALIVVLGTQAAALVSLVEASAGTSTAGGAWLAAGAIVIASAVGRALPVVAAAVRRRSAPPPVTDGFGAWFVARVTRRDVGNASAVTVVLVVVIWLLTGDPAVVVGAGAGALIGAISLVAIATRRGGLDGDGFGATVEVTVAAVLLATAIAVPG